MYRMIYILLICIIDIYLIPREPSIFQQGVYTSVRQRVYIYVFRMIYILFRKSPAFLTTPRGLGMCDKFGMCGKYVYIYNIYIYHIQHIYYTEPIYIYTHLSTITGVRNFPWARKSSEIHIFDGTYILEQ